MKHIKIKSVLALGFAAVLCSSCNDWLTLYPQNKITEEQFWEDMNDLQGVRYAAYRSFASGGMVEKILNWGEVRSDNFKHTLTTSSAGWQDYEDMINARLDTASSYYDWSSLYTTINYCNKVLEHGEDVVNKDKQFTKSQWNAIKAEMVALRALNYFYLIRAFSDVPLVMSSIDTDAQVKSISQSPMIEVLDTIIGDVKLIESGYAVTNQSSGVQDTKCTFTQPAIDALLADMLLWRASYWDGRDSMTWAKRDYADAVKYARKSFDGLTEQNYNTVQGGGNSQRDEKDNGPFNLLQNYRDVANELSVNFNAFSTIFTKGYSDESLFEMPFTSDDKVGEGVLSSFFGVVNASNGRRFMANAGDIFSTAQPQCTDANSVRADRNMDLRMVYNCAYTNDTQFDIEGTGGSQDVTETNSNGYILKWTKIDFGDAPEIDLDTHMMKFKLSFSYPDYRNFIIYRKSDVLLIEAEALAAMGEQYERVDSIIYELRLRSSANRSALSMESVNKYINGLPADKDAYSFHPEKVQKYLRAVMNERQLELYAEGKRWFDLVRWAERTQKDYLGKSHNAEWKMYDTFFSGTLQMVGKSRVNTRWALYNPVYYYEREASNYLLKQNPFWDDDLETN